MPTWYWIGVLAGVGVAFGVLVAGVFPRWVAALAAAAIAAAIGVGVFGWEEAVAGVVGGVTGALGAIPVVRGALRRGGTRGGVAALVSLISLGLALFAFVPVAGFLEALALPGLGARTRAKEPERYAGLRTLARD